MYSIHYCGVFYHLMKACSAGHFIHNCCATVRVLSLSYTEDMRVTINSSYITSSTLAVGWQVDRGRLEFCQLSVYYNCIDRHRHSCCYSQYPWNAFYCYVGWSGVQQNVRENTCCITFDKYFHRTGDSYG